MINLLFQLNFFTGVVEKRSILISKFICKSIDIVVEIGVISISGANVFVLRQYIKDDKACQAIYSHVTVGGDIT